MYEVTIRQKITNKLASLANLLDSIFINCIYLVSTLHFLTRLLSMISYCIHTVVNSTKVLLQAS